MLTDMKCVEKVYLTASTTAKPSLFSKRIEYQKSDIPLDKGSIVHYQVSHRSLLRLSQFIQNTRLKANG